MSELRGPGISDGFTWKKERYFVNRVIDQHGRSICLSCSIAYWLEFENSRVNSLPTLTQPPTPTPTPTPIPINPQWVVDNFGHITNMSMMITELGKMKDFCLKEEEYQREYTGVKQAPLEVTNPANVTIKGDSNPKCKTEKDLIRLIRQCPLIIVVTPTVEFRAYRPNLLSRFNPFESFKPAIQHTKEAMDHSLFVIGYRKIKPFLFGEEETQVLVKNSWGSGWGEKGFAWVKLVNGPDVMNFLSGVYSLQFVKPQK